MKGRVQKSRVRKTGAGSEDGVGSHRLPARGFSKGILRATCMSTTWRTVGQPYARLDRAYTNPISNSGVGLGV